jgi:hypothetical protein
MTQEGFKITKLTIYWKICQFEEKLVKLENKLVQKILKTFEAPHFPKYLYLASKSEK